MITGAGAAVRRSPMEPTWSVTPGRLTATQARALIVIASLFLLFGLVLVGVGLAESGSSETGMRIALGAFLLVWIAACTSMIVTGARVLGASRGARPGTLVEVHRTGGDPGERLRRLQDLRRDGLITEEEFREKRAETMRDV
jgi:hypothetical protein